MCEDGAATVIVTRFGGGEVVGTGPTSEDLSGWPRRASRQPYARRLPEAFHPRHSFAPVYGVIRGRESLQGRVQSSLVRKFQAERLDMATPSTQQASPPAIGLVLVRPAYNGRPAIYISGP